MYLQCLRMTQKFISAQAVFGLVYHDDFSDVQQFKMGGFLDPDASYNLVEIIMMAQ